MIPLAYIQAWRAHAPWPDLRQVEQDLTICRALCDLFSASAHRRPAHHAQAHRARPGGGEVMSPATLDIVLLEPHDAACACCCKGRPERSQCSMQAITLPNGKQLFFLQGETR